MSVCIPCDTAVRLTPLCPWLWHRCLWLDISVSDLTPLSLTDTAESLCDSAMSLAVIPLYAFDTALPLSVTPLCPWLWQRSVPDWLLCPWLWHLCPWPWHAVSLTDTALSLAVTLPCVLLWHLSAIDWWQIPEIACLNYRNVVNRTQEHANCFHNSR
jgi:hypothetical protein